MKILGVNVGPEIVNKINLWFDDTSQNLPDITNKPKIKKMLRKFQRIVRETGAVNIKMVEFFNSLLNFNKTDDLRFAERNIMSDSFWTQ